MRFDINASHADEIARVAVRGELDIATAPQLAAALADGDADAIVIDLSAVTFLDSSGLHVLLRAYDEFGDRLRIIASKPCYRAIAIAGLLDRLPLDTTQPRLCA